MPTWRLSFAVGICAASGWGLVAGNVLRLRGAALDLPIVEVFAVTNVSALLGGLGGAALFLAGSVDPLWTRSNGSAGQRRRRGKS